MQEGAVPAAVAGITLCALGGERTQLLLRIEALCCGSHELHIRLNYSAPANNYTGGKRRSAA